MSLDFTKDVSVGRSRTRSAARVAPTDLRGLGFGTARLAQDARRVSPQRLIGAALDAGIVYFDTARMYGDGQAESLLGDALGRDRDRVVLASKVGILPPSRSFAMRATRRAVNGILKAAPRAARYVGMPQAAQPRFGAFDGVTMRRSVETSLRKLRTDRLDVLLLHDCRPTEVTDEVVETLETLKSDGKVLRIGVASDTETVEAVCKTYPQLGEIVQVHAFSRPAVRNGLLVTHSVLGERLGHLRRWCAERVEEARRADLDPADDRQLGRALLAQAVRENRNGLVLFSSSDPDNIRRSAGAIHALPARPTRAEQMVANMLSDAASPST